MFIPINQLKTLEITGFIV